MRDYLFVLGRNSRLSLIELVSYFIRKEIKFKLKSFDEEIAIFSLPELDFNRVILELGGTVKIGEIIFSCMKDELEYNLEELSLYNGESNKISYSVALFGKKDMNLLEDFRNYLKERFRKEKLKAVYKKPKENYQLMPRDIVKKDLIEFFLLNKEEVIFGKVIAIFDPFKVKERDLKKPNHDYLKESSIRLAKILVNLSQVKENELLLDPFCGYGVILQEALLMNINVLGIDVDKESVINCRDNLNWLKSEYKVKNKFEVRRGDSTKSLIDCDVCVTEPYLGPFLKKFPTIEEANQIVFDLEKIYSSFLKILSKKLKKKTVIVVPEFKTLEKKIVKVNFLKILKENNFKLTKIMDFENPIKFEEGWLDRWIFVIEKD